MDPLEPAFPFTTTLRFPAVPAVLVNPWDLHLYLNGATPNSQKLLSSLLKRAMLHAT